MPLKAPVTIPSIVAITLGSGEDNGIRDIDS